MPFTIGLDCEVIIDGTGYFVKPGSYTVKQPRIRRITVRADASESYIDLGPGRREWSMIILCLNDLCQYDGIPTGLSGEQYRSSLYASYLGSIGQTINFLDPLNNSPLNVHFDDYQEAIRDLHSQINALALGNPPGASYEVKILLREA